MPSQLASVPLKIRVTSRPNGQALKATNFLLCINAYNFNKQGICIYSKPHISVTVLDYTYMLQEYIWCSVSQSNGENCLLCCIYRSPSSADANDLQPCSMLEDILHTNYRDTIVIGDYNFGCSQWLAIYPGQF